MTRLTLILYLLLAAAEAQQRTQSVVTDEIALARSAAPSELSRDATVYVLRDGAFEKQVDGKNGFTCLVLRDDDPRALYSVCLDPE